jgi:RNA polymerase sigma-70 factor, ECF subfamily
MDEQREPEVASGLREGRTEAWHALYDAYARRVWLLVARLMGSNSADVADVVQETFLAAARSAAGYDPARGSLWVWLSGIARNHVALCYRKRRRHDRLVQANGPAGFDAAPVVRWLADRQEQRQEDPADALASVELAAMVRTTLTELPDEYGALLTAKYLDGATVEEIAGRQQRSLTAVRSQLARARRAFREALQKTSSCCDGGHAKGEGRDES